MNSHKVMPQIAKTHACTLINTLHIDAYLKIIVV